jgi:mitochondrial protein import protein ZIM17
MFRARVFSASVTLSRTTLQCRAKELSFLRYNLLCNPYDKAYFRQSSFTLRSYSCASGHNRTFTPSSSSNGQPDCDRPQSASTNSKLFMVFTCVNCDTRAVKSFSKRAYEKGVVLVQCPGCQKRHVIADHLGWFGEHKDVDEILRAKGESVRRITDADLEDLSGTIGSGMRDDQSDSDKPGSK